MPTLSSAEMEVLKQCMHPVWDAMHEGATLCSDCPPVGYPTDSTRCDECPRKSPPVVDIPQVADNATTDSVNGGENTYFQRRSSTVLSDIPLPTYCGCNELLQDLQQLEAHVERGCWRKA